MFSPSASPVDAAESTTNLAPSAAHEPRRATVRLMEHQGQRRQALQAFIAQRFREAYEAEVHQFMPRLFGLYDGSDELIAAFGLRSASDARLFLEQYLDEPVERVVSRRFGVEAQRNGVVEVGNLAGATPGALRRLIPALTEQLHAEGHRWLAFTGAAHLCNGFARLGLPLHVVAAAQPERLPRDERASWGRYYERHPSVMLGDIANGQRTLQRLAQSPRALQAQLAPIARVGAP